MLATLTGSVPGVIAVDLEDTDSSEAESELPGPREGDETADEVTESEDAHQS